MRIQNCLTCVLSSQHELPTVRAVSGSFASAGSGCSSSSYVLNPFLSLVAWFLNPGPIFLNALNLLFPFTSLYPMPICKYLPPKGGRGRGFWLTSAIKQNTYPK